MLNICVDFIRQVAKIRMNEHNFSGAEFHIDQAKIIDPDFCDIDMQYALYVYSTVWEL